MAAIRHIGFGLTSSYCIREHFYVLNIVLNFQVHWFSNFWYSWTFIFSAFWLEIATLGAKNWHLGVNRGQMLTLNILTPERHILVWFRAFWAIMRQSRSKGLIPARASEKEWSHFTCLPKSPPWTNFYQTWNKRSPHCDKFFWQSVQGFKFYRRSF